MADRDLEAHLDRRTKAFRGDLTKLERAIGIYLVGKKMGYKVMLLVHDRRTLKECDEILDLKLQDELPEVGPYANKSIAWLAVQKVSNFWKAVKGEIPGIRSTEAQKL